MQAKLGENASDRIHEMDFPGTLISNCKSANMRYKLYLEEHKKLKAISEIGKRKRVIKENISEITRKRQRLMVATKRKTEEPDDLAAKAETSSDFKLLKESNMIRK